MVCDVSGDELTVEDLRRRQRVEREDVAHASTEAEAETHQRRADKAEYLREKLQEQERADRAAKIDAGD